MRVPGVLRGARHGGTTLAVRARPSLSDVDGAATVLAPVITVNALTRRFGHHTAIDNLGFHLERGEVVGFLGPNGAGKSTTMRILAGYLPATSGSAQVAGFDVLRQSMEVRKRIGYLPESVPLYTEHRVVEMMQFQARLHGMRGPGARKRTQEILERVGIADRSDVIIGKLSRGQRQRVGLAVALLPNPEVLILDEPTSGLDPLQRLEIRKLLLELAREHTVLLSSHILPEIEAVCPRVIILSKGRIAADGTKDELVRTLGGGSHVRLEAFVPDAAAALRMLQTTRGVASVVDCGLLGIHRVFEILCNDDLREDIGALAHAKHWAIRELSWRKPSLEELFARIALDLPAIVESTNAATLRAVAAPTQALHVELQQHIPLGVTGVEAKAGKVLYNLNPFDGGAARDLSRPKAVDESGPGDTHSA